jgi:hypothetical protein
MRLRKHAVKCSSDFRRANILRQIFAAADIPPAHTDVMFGQASGHGALIGMDRKSA